MKKSLLLIAVAIMTCINVFAATWNKPVPPQYTIKGGESFYLYNVAQSRFLCAAGTLASLGDEGEMITATALASGDFKFKTSQGFMFSDIDYVSINGDDLEANTEWYVEQQTSGVIYIRPSKNDPDYSWAARPDEWTGISTETWQLVPLVKSDAGQIEWKAVSAADYGLFLGLCTLDRTMTELQGYGYDVTSLLSIYNKENVTKADIDAALESVASVLRDYRIDNANDSNPADVTDLYMQNPSFTESFVQDGHDLPGWTMVPAAFCGMSTTDVTGTYYEDDKIIASWAGGAFGDNKVYQQLTGLRNGKYRLGNYGIWIRHTGEEGDPISGAYLYAKVGDKLFKQPLTDTGWWRGETLLNFECRVGGAEVGIMFEGTNVGQCLIFDFRLEYLGEIKVNDRLNDLIDKSAVIIADGSANAAYIDALMKNTEAAKALIADGSDSDKEALYTTFIADYEEAVANVEAYNKLIELIDLAERTIAKGSSAEMQTLSDYIYEKELADAAKERQYNNVELTTIIAELSTLIETAANSVINPGDDITHLVVNGGFDTVGGWTAVLNDFSIDSSKKVMERWWCDWKAEQIIANIPNGTYRLEVQGFQWCSWDWNQSQVDWEAGDGTPTYKVTALLGLNDVYVPINNVFSCGPTDIKEGYDAGSYFVPNDATTACKFFDLGLYQNTVEAEVTDNTLKITFDCSVQGFWNCFKNLRLTYVSTDYTDAINDIIDSKVSDRAAYNLQGMKVDPATVKGVYIQNGRKYINR